MSARGGNGRTRPPEDDGRTALDMIADCFRHQHPEAFGQAPVPGAVLPIEVRGGRDEAEAFHVAAARDAAARHRAMGLTSGTGSGSGWLG